MSINGPTVHHAFSDYYYRTFQDYKEFHTKWMGAPIVKCPFDLWLYQEIIYNQRPDVIVETGTFLGGSAYYMAHLCDLLDHGSVITIDINDAVANGAVTHPRIEYVVGSSTAPGIVSAVRKSCESKTALVILDSDHTAAHVFDEMQAYHSIVPVGGYMIVEDTNRHAYPGLAKNYGPDEAIRRWQPKNKGFEVDRAIEKFGFSFNPGGYLKRIRP